MNKCPITGVIHKNEPNQMKPSGTRSDLDKFFGDLPTVKEVEEAKAELIPENVEKRVEAMEKGKTIIGGRNCGKTWAGRIVNAKSI